VRRRAASANRRNSRCGRRPHNDAGARTSRRRHRIRRIRGRSAERTDRPLHPCRRAYWWPERLDGAVNDLRGFVAENRDGLGQTFDHLNAITTALNDSRGDVKQALHIAPTVFQNFTNIYQPAQSAITGILAPVNFADTVQFICSSIQAAAREGAEQSAKLCTQYLAAIIKNRQDNYPPLGINPFVGAVARPHEITYSQDRPDPHLPPAEAPPGATATDPGAGLAGMMIPGGSP
jgi:phospholipid/cholesterol/gamma-HCH transport system substrate-binding protein